MLTVTRPDPNRRFSIRIIEPTIFRGAHAEAGAVFHDVPQPDMAVMVGAGRAVIISTPAVAPVPLAPPPPEPPAIETAEAPPTIESPESHAPKRTRKRRSAAS